MKMKLIRLIIFSNILVFLGWTFGAQYGFDRQFMAANFLVSWVHIMDGRYWVLLTSAFSHNALWHLLLNMFVLYSFGPIVRTVIGFWRFLAFYLSAAILSSLCHAWVSAFILGDAFLPALGASGAVAGVIFLFSFMFPKEKILLLGIIPIPALVGGFLFLGLDLWGLIAQAGGGGLPIGHGAHIGGALTGILYYFLFQKGRPKRFYY